MDMMGNDPYDYILNADDVDLEDLSEFYYRTFKGVDCIFFMKSLRNIYRKYDSMEEVLLEGLKSGATWKEAIAGFRNIFFSTPHEARSEKHFADVNRGAAGKRLNMFFRWMIRNDTRGVDFGIWKGIDPGSLFIPLDIHSGTVARKLGLLNRRQDDWKAVEELTTVLKEFDLSDPVKYDFALFGLGVNEGF